MGLFFVGQPWTADALCAQTDPEVFHPEKGGSTRDAKKVCAKCPVQAECLNWALTTGERFGVWGGLSERERRKLTHHIPCPDCDRTFVSISGVHCHQARAHKAVAA
jgi:WhiB family redox-sensing transcriptional regulator